jgi:galactose-1-phosphate uridylyltransferase
VVVELATRLLDTWRSGCVPGLDPALQTFSLCGRLTDGTYSLSLLPRNGDMKFLTRPTLQAIKKEFLGVFEMIGYAILPSRTEAQLTEIQQCLDAGRPLPAALASHEAWVAEFCAGATVWQALEASFVGMIRDNSPYPYDNLDIPQTLLEQAGIPVVGTR